MGTFGNNFGSNWSYSHGPVVKNKGAGGPGRKVQGFRPVQTIVQRIAIKARIIRPRTITDICIKCVALPIDTRIFQQQLLAEKKAKKAKLGKILGILKSIKDIEGKSKKAKRK